MTDADAAWLAQAQPVSKATCDACFMIADAFRAGSMAVPLVPPGLKGRTPCWLGTDEVLGREEELIAYYERLLAAGAGHHGQDSSAWQPFPYFAVRPAIFEDGAMVTSFSWTDAPETQAVLRAFAEPTLNGSVLDDQDQGWAIRIIQTEGATAFIEWDAEGPPPTAGGRMVQTAHLAEEANAALDRLGLVHDRLIAAFRQDHWTYRPAPPERREQGRLTRVFRSLRRPPHKWGGAPPWQRLV